MMTIFQRSSDIALATAGSADRAVPTASATDGPASAAPAKTFSRRSLLRAAPLLGAPLILPRGARAQSAWPSKPIRIVVTNPAGGLTDQYARQYGEALSRKVGQPVVVENRPGASGMIAADAVAKAPPDGHTLLVAISTTLWHGRVLYRNMPFNPDRDFAPISLFPAGALVMGVHAELPIRTPKDYVDHARKTGGSMGTYSPASWPHMIADTWNRNEKLNIQVVHYKGEAPMWVDISTGQVNGGVGSSQAMQTYVQRGSVRPIAVVGSRRSPKLPDVPTFAEQGYKDPIFTLEGWIPCCAPAGTPEDILQRVAETFVEARSLPKIQALHDTFGIPDAPTGLAETRRRWKDESPQWIQVADRLGIKLD